MRSSSDVELLDVERLNKRNLSFTFPSKDSQVGIGKPRSLTSIIIDNSSTMMGNWGTAHFILTQSFSGPGISLALAVYGLQLRPSACCSSLQFQILTRPGSKMAVLVQPLS
jgi:hypothetical protein